MNYVAEAALWIVTLAAVGLAVRPLIDRIGGTKK